MDKVRRIVLSAGLLFLALSVVALATEAKTAQYRPDQARYTQYKATENRAECRIGAAPAQVAHWPMPLYAPVLHADLFGLVLHTAPATSLWFVHSHPLRAPPAL